MTGPVTMSDLDGSDIDCSAVRQCARFVGAAAVMLACLGAAVLAGWAWQVESLISPLPSTTAMRPNSAVCFVALGMSVWCGRSGTARWRRSVGFGCATLALLITAVTVAEYSTGSELVVDRLLFGSDPALLVQPYPGRMAPHTAAGLLLLSVAQMVLPAPRDPPSRRVVASQILALSASALGLLGLYGYVYNVPEFVSPFGVTAMALHTAIALTVGSIAVFVARPTSGPAHILTTRAKTAMLTRWILLMTLLILPLLGWLGLIGESRGVYGTQSGVALLVAANGAIFTVVTFITGSRAARLEISCRQAEAALAWHSAAAAMAEAAPDAMVGVDSHGVIVLVNAQAERLFGYPRIGMVGRSAELLLPEAALSIHAVHQRDFGVREPVLHTALHVRRRDSTEVPVEISLSTIDTGGQRLVIAAVHDVTERVRHET